MFGIEIVDILIALGGITVGAITVFIGARGRVNEEASLKDMFKRAYFDTVVRLKQELDLNEGLTQELAAQAKLVK